MLFLLIILLTVSISVAAAPKEKEEEWEKIATPSSEDSVYVDAASIKEVSAGAKEAWFRYEYDPPKCAAEKEQCYYEIVEHRRLLADKTTCSLFIYISFTDTTFSTHNFSCTTERIAPGSTAEAMWKRVYR